MYKHMLIPTDGSAFSEMAIRQGIAFARAIRAKVTALAVSPSFHLFEVDPIMVGYTPSPEQYARDSEYGPRVSRGGEGGGRDRRCPLRDRARDTGSRVRGHH